MESESESHSVVSDSVRSHGLHVPWNSPGQNIEVSSLSLLQGIFPTEGSNSDLPHCGQILYHLNHKGSPRIPEQIAHPFSSRSSRPRNQTGVSCIAGAFFTIWAIRDAPRGFWGESKLSKLPCSGSLTPCFVNNDYVIAEIVYSTAYAHHEVPAWSPATSCSTHTWGPLKKPRH